MSRNEEIAKLNANVAALKTTLQQCYGTVLALETVLLVLIDTHPNPSSLFEKLALRSELVEAHFSGESLSEAALTYLQEALKRASGLCQTHIAEQAANK